MDSFLFSFYLVFSRKSSKLFPFSGWWRGAFHTKYMDLLVTGSKETLEQLCCMHAVRRGAGGGGKTNDNQLDFRMMM